MGFHHCADVPHFRSVSHVLTETNHMMTTCLPLISLAVGYFIAWASYIPPLRRQRAILKENPDTAPELRLWWLLYSKSWFDDRALGPPTDPSAAPLETIGLFGFAWTSLGPPHVHWIAPMIFSSLVGIANYSIYMSTID